MKKLILSKSQLSPYRDIYIYRDIYKYVHVVVEFFRYEMITSTNKWKKMGKASIFHV